MRLGRARCELLEEPGWIYAPGAVCVRMGVCAGMSVQVDVGVCVWVCRDLTCQLQATPLMASGLSPFWPLPCAQVCQVGAAWTR